MNRSYRAGPALLAGLVLAIAACGSELEGVAPSTTGDAEPDQTDDAEVAPPDADDAHDGQDDDADNDDAHGDAPGETDDGADTAPADSADIDDTAEPGDAELAPPGPCDGLTEGAACDDGDLCTLGDRCVEGQCLPTAPLVCDDDNVCTDDTCRAEVGCVHLSNLAFCDDGDPCTAGDRCTSGICRPGGETCDDGNPCTRDACAPSGACSNVPDDTLGCEDASACTAGDFCAGGVCVSGLGDGCAEDDPCVAVACGADGLTCELTMLDGETCDDGDACTTADTCQGGLCRAGAALKCPWDTECAAFRCDRELGCLLDTTYQEGKSCSDDDRCTLGEKCDGLGVCKPVEAAECDDDNPCTEDSCDASWGCEHSWVSGTCDDKSLCTTADVCEFGQCRGTAVSCDDGDACTTDSCDPLTGCQHLPLACDDANPCTSDSCEPAAGCRFTPRSGACDDGLACTVLEGCVAGVCVAGATTCDDADPCTVDVCDAEEGCLNVPLSPCPIGTLRIAAVGVNDDPAGVGQWVAVDNDSDATFELAGYALRGEGCGCEAPITRRAILGARATAHGLRASSPSPQPEQIAPGGPASADAFDFVFGAAGDGFFIDPSGDVIELIAPGGEVVDAFDVDLP